MEAAEQRRQNELEQRMQQQAAQREHDLSVMRKVVSRSIANSHLSSLKDRALAHLVDAGSFTDSVQVAVNSQVVPQFRVASSPRRTRRLLVLRPACLVLDLPVPASQVSPKMAKTIYSPIAFV